MMGVGQNSNLQGYNLSSFGMDAALKYKFLKNKMASVSISCSDVLGTKRSETYSANNYFIQSTQRIRDQHFFKINFMYNFGKFDTSLLKRKNMNMDSGGMENMGG